MTVATRRVGIAQMGFLTDMAVHPAAAVFPMLSDDELQELADHIKANGLQHPIVLDRDGVLIDGRNRFAACNLAGVEPTFTTYEGDDPSAFILGENISRRHMSKGQQAMAVALMLAIEDGKQSGARAKTLLSKVSEARVSQAVTVRKFAPDLATLVLSGARYLNEAYAEARERKAAQESQADADARALPDGADPVAFILSSNLQRRHISKGQQAMAAAQVRLVTNRSMQETATLAVARVRVFQKLKIVEAELFFKNNSRQDELSRASGVSRPAVAKAAVVKRYAPDLAALVRGRRERQAGPEWADQPRRWWQGW